MAAAAVSILGLGLSIISAVTNGSVDPVIPHGYVEGKRNGSEKIKDAEGGWTETSAFIAIR